MAEDLMVSLDRLGNTALAIKEQRDELLAFAKAALPSLEHELEQREFGGNDEYCDDIRELVEQCRAAIEKAEGRA